MYWYLWIPQHFISKTNFVLLLDLLFCTNVRLGVCRLLEHFEKFLDNNGLFNTIMRLDFVQFLLGYLDFTVAMAAVHLPAITTNIPSS